MANPTVVFVLKESMNKNTYNVARHSMELTPILQDIGRTRLQDIGRTRLQDIGRTRLQDIGRTRLQDICRTRLQKDFRYKIARYWLTCFTSSTVF
ncbi:hypothetical protein CEXT_542341 [Caerostris extrusa]|uniref:Uncharacterized protein n=1 Tax=Caerostris extrusa TaxID=172846 RepID=A0AAV4XCI1_CAEEX|nr:hypothetical protein CEXT_542341 [Caerostris extrusa]